MGSKSVYFFMLRLTLLWNCPTMVEMVMRDGTSLSEMPRIPSRLDPLKEESGCWHWRECVVSASSGVTPGGNGEKKGRLRLRTIGVRPRRGHVSEVAKTNRVKPKTGQEFVLLGRLSLTIRLRSCPVGVARLIPHASVAVILSTDWTANVTRRFARRPASVVVTFSAATAGAVSNALPRFALAECVDRRPRCFLNVEPQRDAPWHEWEACCAARLPGWECTRVIVRTLDSLSSAPDARGGVWTSEGFVPQDYCAMRQTHWCSLYRCPRWPLTSSSLLKSWW